MSILSTKSSINFDEKAREFILKTLSVTGEHSEHKKHKIKKKGFINKIKGFIGRTKNNHDPINLLEFELEVCVSKLKELEKCLTENHKLMLGIRPERLKLEKKDPHKKYENCLTIKPTVCELLGGEYNVHFTFCGKNMVGRIDAKEKITTSDEIVVKFSLEDLYVFDTITGDTIK